MSNHINIINHPNDIVEVQLNRPDKKNALSFEMISHLIKIGNQISNQKQTRVVLLTGANHSFSAGIDLNDLRDPKNKLKTTWQFIKPGLNIFQNVNLIWRKMPIPVIAVLEGYCFGAGFELALASDFRISKADTKFSIMESKWGLIPDMGITETMRGLIALDKAKELAMTARVFTGIEAEKYGLVTYIDENPFEKAMELSLELINRSPDAIAGIKKIFNSMVSDTPSKSLALEKNLQRKIVLGKNSKIAVKKDKNPSIQFSNRAL